MGTKMCLIVDLSQLQDFMPTLVKNAHVYSRLLFTKKNPPEKGGTGLKGPPLAPLWDLGP